MPAQGRWMTTAKLRALFEAGLTYDEIGALNEESEGWRPTRSTVKRKYEAMGMPPRHFSSKDVIPWTVKPEHTNHLFRHMLNAEARRRRGAKLSDSDRKLLARMHNLLFGRGTPMVFDYDPNSRDGFMLVLRTDDDTDIFRAPSRMSAYRLDIQAALRDAATDRELAQVAQREGVRPELLENAGRDAAADLLRALHVA